MSLKKQMRIFYESGKKGIRVKALIIGFGSIGQKHFLALKALKCEIDVLSVSYANAEFKDFESLDKSVKNSPKNKFSIQKAAKNARFSEISAYKSKENAAFNKNETWENTENKGFVKASFENFSFKLYRNLEKIKLQKYDLFIIANITTSHFEALKALEKRVKNKVILVEKPLFERYKPYKSKKNSVFVAYLLRFHPVITALREILKDEKPYFAEFSCHSYLPKWRKIDYTKNYSAKKELGGGVGLDLSHEIDLALFLFDKARLKFSEHTRLSELKINSEDLCFLALKNRREMRIHVSLSYFSKFNERLIKIHTPNFSVRADLIANKIEIYRPNGEISTHNYEANTINTLISMHEAIIKKDKNLCSVKEGLKVMKILDKTR